MLQLWKVRDAVERFEGMLVLQVAGLVGLVSLKSGLVGSLLLYTVYCILYTGYCCCCCCCLLLFAVVCSGSRHVLWFCGSDLESRRLHAFVVESSYHLHAAEVQTFDRYDVAERCKELMRRLCLGPDLEGQVVKHCYIVLNTAAVVKETEAQQ